MASTRPSARTTVASPFTKVAGHNTTPLPHATVAPSAVPPSQNMFAPLDAADESPALAAATVDNDAVSTADEHVVHTDGTPQADVATSMVDDDESHTAGTPRAAGDSQADEGAAGPVDEDVVHTTDTEGTLREDGDSQPLLDRAAITDPFVDTLTAHDRVLMTTIAGIAEADRALDLAITGIATALDEDDDDATDANTMASSMPVIPHGVVSAPTMEAFMLVLQSLQTQNHAILTR